MASLRPSRLQRVSAHTLLLGGAALFIFPFFWMVTTSFKTRREVGVQNAGLLPKVPQARGASPYIDSDHFKPTDEVDGVPPAVWKRARTPIEEWLHNKLAGWEPQTLEWEQNPPPYVDPAQGAAACGKEVTEGVIETLSRRLSDEARNAALRAERARQGTVPTDAQLLASLSDDAITSGVQSILANAQTLTDEWLLRETFDQAYRRFTLADVRIRTARYESASLFTGTEWTSDRTDVRLVTRRDGAPAVQEVRWHITTPERNGARFTLAAPAPPFPPADIDRIFVSYRGDESWARIHFSVIRDGWLYETHESAHLFERDFVEQELRWPQDATNLYERRRYMVLHRVGPAPARSAPLEVTMHVHQTSSLEALAAKFTMNYRQTFREVPYARYVMTSLSLVILNTVLSILSCTLVGYGFARLNWPGRDFLFVVLLATMMLPPQVTMIPTFLIIKELGWYNSLLPLWALAAFGQPFFIFLTRQFFRNIPTDLEDAARIDGCGFLRIYWHVMLPLIQPVVATIAIFTFMGTWNNFMGPLIYVNDERLFPLAMGLFKVQLLVADNIGLMMAASCLMTLPVIALFFFLQRYFVQGITLTGGK